MTRQPPRGPHTCSIGPAQTSETAKAEVGVRYRKEPTQ